MTGNKKILAAKISCILSAVPALMYAHEYGPNAGFTGAPGDNPTACINGGCHVGTVNQFSGNVKIAAAGGTSYVPGQTQLLTIVITDSSQKSWGFETTARLAGDLKGGQAGDFSNIDGNTQVICGDDRLKANGKSCSSQFPLQYAEHTLAGWGKGRGINGTYSFQVNWTAPAEGAGDVMLYVAANASNNTTTAAGGHIYTSSLKLSPAAAGGAKPSITSGGVVNNATGLASGIAPNTYISIFGSNFNTNTRSWAGPDFGNSGRALPTSLDGTSVKVNGKDAYVEFISPTQINAITPADSSTGSGITVSVTTDGQTSDPASVTLNAVAPAFFTFDGKYLAAADARSGAFVGKVGLFPTAPNITAPAKPGQIVTLYGTGFGPTSPQIAPGIVTDMGYDLNPTPVVMVGGSPASVLFSALTPGFAQVYQFNITIPAGAPDGDLQIFATTNGVSTPNSSTCCFITVQK